MIVEAPAGVDAVHRHGWQSWSPSGWVAPDAPFPEPVREIDRVNGDHPGVERQQHESCDVAAAAAGDDVVLLGALRPGGVVRVDPAAGKLVGRGVAEAQWFTARGSEREVFAAYTDALAAAHGSRRSVGRPPRVWCSWYSLGRDVTAAAMEAVVVDLDDLPFDVVQLDDGWQQAIGDWTPNEDFGDLSRIAAVLGQRNRTPGLWLAPFIAHEASRLAAEHPDWLVRDDAGDPLVAVRNWGGDVYALDVTRPEVVEHVVRLAGEVVAAGFGYCKLDFVYAAALPGRRAADVDPEQAYRDAMHAIRDEVGDDVYLLGCGAPILASLGVVDGLRIGPDVAPWWDAPAATAQQGHLGHPTARYAVATSIGRTWLAPLVDLDPDVVLLRSRRSLLGPDARALLVDVARICGFVGTSDPIPWLQDDERAALAGLLTEEPTVERVGRHHWRIDGRDVDLSWLATAAPGVPLASPDTPRARLREPSDG